MVMTDGPVAPGDKTPLFGGPYQGFTESANPGDTNKDDIVERHLKSFKEQVDAAQEFAPTFINSHSLKVVICVHMDHHSSTKTNAFSDYNIYICFVFQDYLTPKMAAKFFEEALRWTKDKGILIWIL